MRNNIVEIKGTINEMRNTPDGINSRMGEAKGLFSVLKDREIESNWLNEGKRSYENKNRLRECSVSIKGNNIHIIGVSEEEERKKGTENLFEEIIAKNIPDLGKETDIQIQEAQTVRGESHHHSVYHQENYEG